MKVYDFSIIIINNNHDNLLTCIESIANQNYNLEKIEIIIETTEIDKEILNKIDKLKINYTIREQQELDTSICYNDALKISNGEYIQFINSNIILNNKESLKKILEFSNLNEIICCNIHYFDQDTNTSKQYILSSGAEKNIDLEKTSGQINLCLESLFISKNLCDKIKFDEEFNEECKIKFIVDLYQICPKYYNLGSISLLSYNPFEDNTSKNSIQYDINWYNESLRNWKGYIEKFSIIPIYLQEIIMYIIYSKYNCNLNDRNKNIISDEYLNDFINNTKELLNYLDNTIILQQKIDSEFKKITHRFKIPRSLKLYYLRLKNQTETNNYLSNNTIFETTNKVRTPITNLTNEKINIYAINYFQGKLIFDCTVGIKDYLEDNQINIKIKYGQDDILVTKTEIYNLQKVFGKTFNRKYTFQFEINVENNFKDLKAFIIFDNKEYQLKFNFVKVQSRLNNSKRSYWNYKNFTVENKKDLLKISKSSKYKTLKLEILFIISKLLNEKNKLRVCKLSFLRVLYYITKPFMKNKHIWITFDKLYKAGDNGEYIYQHGLKNNKNIYYIINKDSLDFKRLKKENKKHILVFNSLKAKLFSLHAEAILKTHANIYGFCGFNGLARTFITGIFNAEIIEIQHGLTIQDIPEYQNRLVDNTKLYFIASEFEKNNISQPMYGYKDEQIKLTGLPRFDGLKNNDKKIILITPTWRHSIASPSIKHGKVRGYNNLFKQSDYYKIYNSLINNKKLINCAIKNNYEIKYLIHPTLSNQIEDFKKNDYVEIIPAAGNVSYERILRESSIMVTDYSGVQYDFAYMKKPIIYFHPNELPPHYNNGSMDYEKNGFGKITKTIDDLVMEICKTIEKKCANEKTYTNRANEFFKYDDLNNCKRIIDEIDCYLKTKKEDR